MPQTPTLRRNHLEVFLTIKKIVKLYEQPWGPFLEPLPGLVVCPGFQHQLWAWNNSNECRVSKKKKVSSEFYCCFSFSGLFLMIEGYYITKESSEGKKLCFKNSGENSNFTLVFKSYSYISSS